jgi:hypothetical protein
VGRAAVIVAALSWCAVACVWLYQSFEANDAQGPSGVLMAGVGFAITLGVIVLVDLLIQVIFPKRG